MKGKIIILVAAILLGLFLMFHFRGKPEKYEVKQPVIVRTDDSLVFRQLRKIDSYRKADSFYMADMKDSAIYYFNKALFDPTLPHDPKYNQEIYNRLGYTYLLASNYKKAKHYLTKALLFATDKNLNLVDANSFNYLGLLNRYTNESDSALSYLTKSCKIYLGILGDKNMQIVRLNSQIGDVYRWIRFDYYDAEKYYYKALKIFEMQQFDKTSDQYFRILYNLATTNRLKADYNKALSYGLQALQLANTVQNHRRYIELCYGLVANMYLAIDDYKNANEYFDKALEINLQSDKNITKYRPVYLNNLATVNYKLGRYDMAINYCKQVSIILNDSIADFNELSSCFENKGISYQKLHNWPKAFENLKQDLAIRLIHLGTKHPNTAYAYSLIGKFYEETQKLDSALRYYQLAIISGSREFNNSDIKSIPLMSESQENIGLIDYLASKASCLRQKYLNNPNDTLCLVISLKCYELIDSLVSFSRKSMDTEKSKLSFSSTSNELYEGAIDCAFLLYQEKKDNQYIRKAFRFFEKNKYLLLLEKLKMAEAGSKAGVPDSLVESERNLNSELKFCQDKLTEEQNKKEVNTLQVQSLNARIFKLMREIEILHGVFEQTFPNYFKIKYQDVATTLDDLQKYASCKGKSIIQYFWGDKSVYIINVSGNRLNFFRIDNNLEFRDYLAGFIGMMHEVNLTSKERFMQYAQKANNLYGLLVKPALMQSNSPQTDSQTLTIIPDGMLSKLSFDALVTTPSQSSKFSYKNLRYMAYQYSIEYAYSSNILLSNPGTDRRKYMNKLLGFGYAGDDKEPCKRHSNNLPGTVEEMKAVSNYFHSRIYLGQNASEHNFKNNVSKYDMIHLALHGSADEVTESGSKLIFRNEKDTVEDGMLYANEIYNLKLKAKLVVLSACETGIGKNYQGEGVFSMARAFAYAGCPSIVISLWKVNDQSTADVMGSFYKNLSKGEEIGRSLHRAKLTYLENTDEIGAQPVFWASFVAFGDMSPIKTGSHYIIWFVALIIIVGGFLFYKFGLRNLKRYFVSLR